MPEALSFAAKLLATTLIFVPWWLFRRLSGRSFFGDAGLDSYGLDAFGNWAVAICWLCVVGFLFTLGGSELALIGLGAIAALALLWAAIWTTAQSLGHMAARRKAITAGGLAPTPLPMFLDRFVANFRATVVEFPARLIDGV